MPAIKELDNVRTEIRAEVGLLDSRLNALISSQSFILIAYGSVLSAGYGDWHGLFTLTLPPMLAVLGAVMVLQGRPGIGAAKEAIGDWRAREQELTARHQDLLAYTLATDGTSRQRMQQRQHAGQVFSTRAPFILLAAWGLFFLLPFGLYFWA